MDATQPTNTVLSERYELLEKLGEGGYGVVYRARHILIDKQVAIKILKKAECESEESLQRFQFEAKAASRLSHPNIVAVHDFGLDQEKVPYLVMDLVQGTALGDFLDEFTRISVEDAIDVFIDVCSGLQHAHEKNLIHRDLKASNIILTTGENGKRWTGKILDFGLAKVIGYEGQSQKLTPSGMVVGTFAYLSPEQCLGKEPDERSDIYSIGCAFYEAVTGLPPFVGDNVLETVQLHLNEKPKSLGEARPDLEFSSQLEAVVERLLAKSPEDRFQSAAEVKVALLMLRQNAGDTIGGAATWTKSKPRSEKLKKTLPLVAAAALILGFSTVKLLDASKPPTQPASNAITLSYRALKSGNQAAASEALTTASAESAKSRDAEANRLANLAAVCHQKGQCDTAADILLRSVEISKKVYGPTSPETADRMTELASFYMALGKSDKAQQLIDQVMDIRAHH